MGRKTGRSSQLFDRCAYPPRHFATVKDRCAWVTLFGLSFVTACGPSARQQALCDLQKNVGQLEQRLRHSEAHARALDERLMVLHARNAPAAAQTSATQPALDGSVGKKTPAAVVAAPVPSPAALMPEEGISLSEGRSLAANRSIRLRGPTVSPAAAPQTQTLPKRLQHALRAYQRGAFKQAFGQFAGFVRQHPKHPAADRARFWMGECKFEQGALMESIAQFARLEREHPKSPKAPEALLKMGLAFEKLAAPDEAFATYRRLIQSFPQSASAELATTRLAKPAPRSPAS
jgi:tol-pal system protein YbgF